MANVSTTITEDAKEVVHAGIAGGLGALGAGLVADATGVADALVAGNWTVAEHIGLTLAAATALAAWAAARKVLARVFGGGPDDDQGHHPRTSRTSSPGPAPSR